MVKELASRGHQVTAFARNAEKVVQADNVTAVNADVLSPNFAEQLQGFDAVVSAFNAGWTNPNIVADFTLGQLPSWNLPKQQLCRIYWWWAVQAVCLSHRMYS